MDVGEMQTYCLAKPGAWADNPWDHDLPVIKVGGAQGDRAGRDSGKGKIFAFLGAGAVGLKGGASREVADAWLERYPGAASVMRYLGRSGWNDLSLLGEIPDDELLDAVDESYRLVVEKLPRKARPTGWEDV